MDSLASKAEKLHAVELRNGYKHVDLVLLFFSSSPNQLPYLTRALPFIPTLIQYVSSTHPRSASARPPSPHDELPLRAINLM